MLLALAALLLAGAVYLASEVITQISLGYKGEQRLRVQRIGAKAMPLPSAMELERAALPSEGNVYDACLELFDE